MDILAIVKSALDVTKLWMSRTWGSQTRDQSAVERDMVTARDKKAVALAALRNAKTDEQITAALVAVNYWDTQLTRLHKEAAAKWP